MSSLRRRLNRVLVVLLAGLVLQWFIADRTLVSVVESEMETRLRHDADTLLASLDLNPAGQITCDPQTPEKIYSTAYSGHYYVIDADGERIHSASFATTRPFDPPAVTADSLDHMQGPHGQPLLVLTTRAEVQGRRIRLSLGEDLSPLQADLTRFRVRFLLLSLLLVAGAMALQARELSWALRALDSVRDAVLRVQSHGTPIPIDDAPIEVRPLVDEVNRLLAFVGRRLQQSRTAVGNLSHAVKTPLTAVFRLLDDPRMASAPDLRKSLEEQAEAIHVRIDRELKRARLAGETVTAARFDAHAELPALVRLLTQIHRDRALTIDWTAPPEPLPFDRQDAIELIGNLADNACKWAAARVRIEIRAQDGFDVVVSDDGPGCSSELLDSLGNRGQRADESVPGYGLGLAIARDIVEHAGGRIAFSRSALLGGLQVIAHLPTPASSPAV